ncbi:hypothetical protein ACFL6O_06455 [candidate division KSB1 bacterium]
MPGPVSGIKPPPPAPKIQIAAAPKQKGPATKAPAPQKSAPATGKGSKINIIA